MHTARLLATTLADKNIVVVNANDLRDNNLPGDTVKSKPTPSMENLITQIAEDLQKRIVVHCTIFV